MISTTTTPSANPLRVVARNPARIVDLVVVLGMHRSGTSAITRSLRTVGVELGDNLMPPHPDQNPKGFWEDMDINALNVEMLASLGRDWHSLAKTSEHDVARLRQGGFMLRAAEILRTKLQTGAPFAFKDPRIAKLLPFWREVFRATRLRVAYVVAVRNPLSVVRSLGTRNEMPAEQAYYLWLDHMMPMLDSIAEEKHVFVEYDRLLTSPRPEIGRIAGALGLEVNEEELGAFEHEFLDPGLRHTEFGPGDLLLDDNCPELVLDVYSFLVGLASADVGIHDDWSHRLQSWQEQLRVLDPALRFADKLAKKIGNLSAQTQALGIDVTRLSQELGDRLQETDAMAQRLHAEAARADEARVQLQARSDEVQALRSELGANLAKDEVATLQEVIVAKTAEALELIVALRKADAEVVERRAQIGALSDRNAALEAVLVVANAEADQGKVVIAALEQTQRHLASEIERVTDALASQAEEAAQRTSENLRLVAAQSRLEEENAGLRQTLVAAQGESAESAARVQELSALTVSLEGEIGRLTATVATAQEQVDRHAVEIEALADVNGRREQEIHGLLGQRALLTSQLAQVQDHARLLSEQHAEILAGTERRASEIAERGEALAIRFAEVATASEAMRDQLTAAREEGLASARHNAALERQIEDLVGQKALLSSQLTEVQDQARLSAQEHAELLTRTDRRASEVAERGEALAARFAELAAASGTVRDQLSAMREEAFTSARHHVELERQLAELRANLASQEHANASLEETVRQQRMTNHELVLNFIARHDSMATAVKRTTFGAKFRRWLGRRTS